MNLNRRAVLRGLGGTFAALSFPAIVYPSTRFVIAMAGTPRGERIWFNPIGLAAPVGATAVFVNEDSANVHTATTYHSDLHGKTTRIPAEAKPWDSGFLMPGDCFSAKLTVPGIYDYYCLPHERAGMLGRIVVGEPDVDFDAADHPSDTDAPFNVLPSVNDVVRKGRITPEDVS